MHYFVYVYNLEDGTAYYVGKGSLKRVFMKHTIPVPKKELVQSFSFATEQEAWDTEIQLIAFYGRQQDGGTLMNLSTGGRSGTQGVIQTLEQRATKSKIAKRLIKERGHPQKGKRGACSHNSLTYIVTTPDGQKLNVCGITQFCRENNLTPSAMVQVSKGTRAHHKGYTCVRS
jgi:hypothetical protein